MDDLFQACNLPLFVVKETDDKVTYPYVHIVAYILQWFGPVSNPFIYAFNNGEYRKAFVKV